MTLSNAIIVKVDGEEYQVYRVRNDINGNARYVIHFIAFDIDNYDNVSRYGFRKYQGKAFGGGIVFQAVNLEDKIRYMVNHVKEVNNRY